MSEATAVRPRVVLSLHVGLLPVARLVARATNSDVALLGIGREVWGPLSAGARNRVAACQQLLAISAFTADVMAARTGGRRDRITVVTPPVDPRLLDAAARHRPGAVDLEPLLLTVARVVRQHRYKGHFAIADSLPAVLAQHPDARWVVVGSGDDVPALRARCRTLGVLHAISFEQHISDDRLVDLYRTASMLVMPSVTDIQVDPPTGEGFGLVYAEAGAFGVPSIASTAGGGAAELVQDGMTGLTVPPRDTAALSGAIIRLLADTDLRRRLGTAARRRVVELYVPSRFTAGLQSALTA